MSELEGEHPPASTVTDVRVVAFDDPGEFRTILGAVVPADALRWIETWPPSESVLRDARILFAPEQRLDLKTLNEFKAAHPHLKIVAIVRRRMGDELLGSLNRGLDGFVRPTLGRHPVGQQIRILMRSLSGAKSASGSGESLTR